MKQFTFHLLTLCHLPQHKKFMACAFTQKNRKLAKMLTDLGHKCYFYASEGSDIEEYCNSENLVFVQTHTLKDIADDYGDGWNLDDYPSINYDFANCDFRHDFNSEKRPSTLKYYEACIKHINSIKKDDDFLLSSQGYYHKPIADNVNLFLTCEPGIGYRGSYQRFRAFESAYTQNFAYGSEHPFECINGHHYDRVIPNYFDPADIKFSADKSDYYLFIGRIIRRKGILIAHAATESTGEKLIIAGQGGVVTNGSLTSNEHHDFVMPPGNWEYIGFADIEKRRELMAHAIATFTPTEYLECFCGVHIESMLSGTPVISTNFGVFPETVINNVNGFRCDTLDDFAYAVQQTKHLDRNKVRQSAERYLMDNVKWEFQKWFEDLYQVYLSARSNQEKGWYHIRTDEPEWRKLIV